MVRPLTLTDPSPILTWQTMLTAFMDTLGLKKADVFDYSMGAITGLQLAIHHPER